MTEILTRRNFLQIVCGAAVELAAAASLNPLTTHAQAPSQLDSIPERFRKLDSEIIRNPNKLNQVAAEICDFACEKVGREIGVDGKNLAQRQFLLEEDDYVNSLNEQDGCKTERNYKAAQGAVLPSSDKAFINLTRIKESPVLQGRAATITIAICMHEAVHQEVKKVALTTPIDMSFEGKIIKGSVRKGVTVIFPASQITDEEEGCMNIAGAKLEEAVAEQANTEWMRDFGFNYDSPAYPEQADAYHGRILVPYFNGQYKSQLMLYLETDPDKFFGNIGAKFKSLPTNYILNPEIADWTDPETGERLMLTVIPNLPNSQAQRFHQDRTSTLILSGKNT